MTRRNEDSGLIDLDALMREATRPPSTPAPCPTVAPPVVRPSDSLDAVSTDPRADPWVATAVRPPETVAMTPSRRNTRSATLGAIGVALAVALVGASIVRSRSAHDAAQTRVAVTVALPVQPAETPVTNDEAPTTAALRADDLPSISTATPRTPAPPGGAATATARPSRPGSVPTLTEAVIDPAGATAGNLGDAMRNAAGEQTSASAAPEAPQRPAAAQVRPSPGAVVGALGSVLPTARACLGPDEPIRSGVVVFRSDGSVARVELRGDTTADECVRSALSKAKVAPFVDATFSTRVTVRP